MKIKLAILGEYDVVEWEAIKHTLHPEQHNQAEFVLLVNGAVATKADIDKFCTKLVENARLLAQAEHHRYMAERLLKGWGFGKRGATPATETLRESFCLWATLPVEERKKDYSQICALARLLNLDVSAELNETIEAENMAQT